MTAEQVLRLHSEGLNQALFLHIIDTERHGNHDVSQHDRPHPLIDGQVYTKM